MAQSVDKQAEPLSIELERGRRSSFRLFGSMSQRDSSFGSERVGDDDYELQWAAIERLSTLRRMRTSVLDLGNNGSGCEEQKEKKVVDVTKLGALERRLLIEKLIKDIENDNLRLLQKQRERIDRSDLIPCT